MAELDRGTVGWMVRTPDRTGRRPFHQDSAHGRQDKSHQRIDVGNVTPEELRLTNNNNSTKDAAVQFFRKGEDGPSHFSQSSQ